MNDKKININKKIGELILSALFLGVGIFFAFYAFKTIPKENIGGQPGIGPRAFPLLASFGMIIFSIIILVHRLISFKKQKEKNVIELDKKGLIRVFSVIVGLITYYFLIPKIGFLLGSIIFLLFVYFICGYENKKVLIFLAVILNLVVYYVFQILLNVSLP